MEFASVSDLSGGVLGFLVYYKQERESEEICGMET